MSPFLYGGYIDQQTGNYAYVISAIGDNDGAIGDFGDGHKGITLDKLLDGVETAAKFHAFHWAKMEELAKSSPHNIFRVVDPTKWFFHMVYTGEWHDVTDIRH